jgi:DNA-binding transcriptional MerR regulator
LISVEKALPAIPAKRYFTIGEVSELCGVKPYVLRYWEQEFTQLKPMKRRGNRRYYQHHEVLLIRRIRDLLYDQGFTISGARNRLSEGTAGAREAAELLESDPIDDDADFAAADEPAHDVASDPVLSLSAPASQAQSLDANGLRDELLSIRDLLSE